MPRRLHFVFVQVPSAIGEHRHGRSGLRRRLGEESRRGPPSTWPKRPRASASHRSSRPASRLRVDSRSPRVSSHTPPGDGSTGGRSRVERARRSTAAEIAFEVADEYRRPQRRSARSTRANRPRSSSHASLEARPCITEIDRPERVRADEPPPQDSRCFERRDRPCASTSGSRRPCSVSIRAASSHETTGVRSSMAFGARGTTGGTMAQDADSGLRGPGSRNMEGLTDRFGSPIALAGSGRVLPASLRGECLGSS